MYPIYPQNRIVRIDARWIARKAAWLLGSSPIRLTPKTRVDETAELVARIERLEEAAHE
jgi:hypothetical protein